MYVCHGTSVWIDVWSGGGECTFDSNPRCGEWQRSSNNYGSAVQERRSRQNLVASRLPLLSPSLQPRGSIVAPGVVTEKTLCDLLAVTALTVTSSPPKV